MSCRNNRALVATSLLAFCYRFIIRPALVHKENHHRLKAARPAAHRDLRRGDDAFRKYFRAIRPSSEFMCVGGGLRRQPCLPSPSPRLTSAA